MKLALANSSDTGTALVLENLLALDNDGWALLAPYGEHRKERTVRANGRLERQVFLQVVDEPAVEELLANENGPGVFQRLKRALIKRPVFKGHPDLAQHAPETVANGREPAVPIGVVAANRKGPRGLETRFDLTPDGAAAVENEGCKFPSALWLVKPTGEVRDGATVVRPFKILSVGLTATPNISGVDSLANAKPNTPAASNTDPTTPNDTMKQLLIGWLAAQGVILANDATDQAVLEAAQKQMTSRLSEITTLGNERANLNTRVTALENEKATLATERDQLKTKLGEKETALGNEQSAHKATARKLIEARVDLHITQGKLAVAERAAKITALENSAKLDDELKALDALPVKFAVANATTPRKDDANANTRTPREQILTLANTDERYKHLPFDRAYDAILKDHPTLAEQLKEKPATK
jgi:hypothetical protein